MGFARSEEIGVIPELRNEKNGKIHHSVGVDGKKHK